MNLHVRPILSTLRRHKTAAGLLVLEMALTCAIVCNALFLIQGRLERTAMDTGMADDELVFLQVAGGAEDPNGAATSRTDLAALRALPGVRAATAVNQVPFGSSSWNSDVAREPGPKLGAPNATVYFGDEHLIETFGVRLEAGRNFTADELIDWAALDEPGSKVALPVVLISRDLADRLFPGENPIGQVMYIWHDAPSQVIGVIDRLIRPNEQGGPSARGYSVVLPVRLPYSAGGRYVLRTDPARRGEVLAAASASLDRTGPGRIHLGERWFSDIRADYFREDRAMAWLLIAVCAALLGITALGIVGLSSFWVQQRTKQIGVRRALGATRTDILRYVQTENFLLATAGIILGMAMAYGLNLWLGERYDIARLPAAYLPVGAATLWLLGQIAVYGPARRAARVPPAIATRAA